MRTPKKVRWPAYLVPFDETTFAIGVIAINYGELELNFRHLFGAVTGVGQPFAELLFPKIQNDVRLQLFDQSLTTPEWPPDLAAALRRFAAGYTICSENRNTIMHFRAGGITLKGTILGTAFTKQSRSGQTLFYPVTTAEFRAIADDMNTYAEFARSADESVFLFRAGKAWQPSLPETPPLPRKLDFQPRRARPSAPPPPEPSPE